MGERVTKAVHAMHIRMPGKAAQHGLARQVRGLRQAWSLAELRKQHHSKACWSHLLHSHVMFIFDTHDQELLGYNTYSVALQAPPDALAHPPDSKGCSSHHKLCSHNTTQDT